jgi:hypothetical protein
LPQGGKKVLARKAAARTVAEMAEGQVLLSFYEAITLQPLFAHLWLLVGIELFDKAHSALYETGDLYHPCAEKERLVYF